MRRDEWTCARHARGISRDDREAAMGVRAAASVFALALVGVTLRIAIAEPAKWQAVGSPEDGFSIDFPGKVVVSQDDFDAKKMVRHRQYLHDQGHTGWAVTATQSNPGERSATVPGWIWPGTE
jgi:hypothetical protein